MEARMPLVDKYRPKKLADVIGQDVAVRILSNSFKAKNWHHAYILEGQFGCGKTSIARIMAAMENCVNAPTLEPCGVCERCIEIFNGNSIDVLEIDAASKRSIEGIRELQETLHQHPIFCNMKYFIIDEAHGLTGYAADAALKMIEEPPAHARFVLCTTKVEGFKSTIPSRCIMLNFRKVDWMVLHQQLCKIAQSEKMPYDEEALKVIAKASQGSVRNALRNLQMVSSFTGDEIITADSARTALSSVDDDLYFQLINCLVGVQAPEAVKCVNKIMINGGTSGQIFDGLIEHLRNLQMLLIGGAETAAQWLTEDEIKRLKSQAAKIKKPSLVHFLFREAINLKKSLQININPQGLMIDFIVIGMIEAVKTQKQ